MTLDYAVSREKDISNRCPMMSERVDRVKAWTDSMEEKGNGLTEFHKVARVRCFRSN